MTDSTVELPADPDIKQLANDVVREDNEYAVPLLRDFYRFLALLGEDDSLTRGDISLEDTDSEMGATAWSDFMDTLENNGVLDGEAASSRKFTLSDAALDSRSDGEE